MSVVDIQLPARSLVVLVGASGSGKSSFAARNFAPTQILSSDQFRAMLCDDAENQAVSHDAFELLYTFARRRLALGRLTVVDATSTDRAARARLIAISREAQTQVVALLFDVPFDDCIRNDRDRVERHVPPEVIVEHVARIRESLASIDTEGFDRVFVLRGRAEVSTARVAIEAQPDL